MRCWLKLTRTLTTAPSLWIKEEQLDTDMLVMEPLYPTRAPCYLVFIKVKHTPFWTLPIPKVPPFLPCSLVVEAEDLTRKTDLDVTS
jgi:hypothetical protein